MILDPLGGTIDHFLDKIGREKKLSIRQELFSRVRYVNMNGQDGYVFPWPIYSQHDPAAYLSEQAERFPDVVERVDPALRERGMLGMNALRPIASAAGTVLAALGLGITEMWDLVSNLPAWEPRLRKLVREQPETIPAVAKLRESQALPARERGMELKSLSSKLSEFTLKPNFRAMFGASDAGTNWSEVVANRQAVLLDFRAVKKGFPKQFCLQWVYHSFLAFVKNRGIATGSPVSFIIDEFSYLTGTAAEDDKLLASDMNELIQHLARNHRGWLTLATQELFELPEQVRNTVLSMGTLLFGRTSHEKTTLQLAQKFFSFNPYKVKKAEPIFVSVPRGDRGWRVPELAGARTTEFTKLEQDYLNSRVFLRLAPGHLLVGRSTREGETALELEPVSLEGLDPQCHLFARDRGSGCTGPGWPVSGDVE